MQSHNKGRKIGKGKERENQIEFADPRFERWEVVRFRKARRRHKEKQKKRLTVFLCEGKWVICIR